MTHSEHAPMGSAARFFYELQEGSRRQANIIFALIFKELKSRSGTDGHGVLSLVAVILESTLSVLVLAGFWWLLRRTEIAGINVGLFLAVSYIPFAMVRRSLSSVPRSIRGSRSFYAFPGVKPFDALFARFILEWGLSMFGGALLLFLLGWFFGYYVNTDKLLQAGLVYLAMTATAFGQGLVVGVYGTKYPMLFKVISLSSRGLVVLSAVMHTVSEVPAETQVYIAWNPFAHYLELIRYYLLGVTPFPAVSITYPLFFMLFMLFLGFTSYWVNRIKVLER